jgi:Mrp family chromosome partitioning ATPase
MNEVLTLEPTVLSALWRYRRTAVLIVLLAAALPIVYGVSRPIRYTATASLIVEDPRTVRVVGAQANAPIDRYVADQMTALRSLKVATRASVLGRAAQPPFVESPEGFQKHTAVNGSASNSSVIALTFTANRPGAALSGLDLVVTAYRAVEQEQAQANAAPVLDQIDATVKSIDDSLSALYTHLQSAPAGPASQALLAQEQRLVDRRTSLLTTRDETVVDASQATSNVVLYSPPNTAVRSSRVGPKRVILFSTALGALAATALAYVLAERRRVFRHSGEPELVLGRPLVGEVPEFRRRDRRAALVMLDRPGSAEAEAFRFAAAALDAQRATRPPRRSVAVTSVFGGGGTTTVVANTALALAASGLRALAVDTDVEGRGLSRLLAGEEAAGGPGWTDVRRGHAPAVLSIAVPGLPRDVLSLVTPGNGHATMARDLAGVRRVLSGLLADAVSMFDLVVVDVPPVLESAFAELVLCCAETSLVVVAHNGLVSGLEELASRFSTLGRTPAGYVYNRSSHPEPPDASPARFAWRRVVGVNDRVIVDSDVIEATPVRHRARVVSNGVTRASPPDTDGVLAVRADVTEHPLISGPVIPIAGTGRLPNGNGASMDGKTASRTLLGWAWSRVSPR